MRLAPYAEQSAQWPHSGRHILAQFDRDTIIVYQAYAAPIGSFAVQNQRFGGPFSFNRMSWIKPNFLWMMYRSGWGTKPGQEMVLAIRIQIAGFNSILRSAVHSTFTKEFYDSEAAWRDAGDSSDVRLQWDPDHDPHGKPVERRAIQLGLRGAILKNYATEWIVEITDLSAFIAEQRKILAEDPRRLITPEEAVYAPPPEIAARIGVAPPPFAANAF